MTSDHIVLFFVNFADPVAAKLFNFRRFAAFGAYRRECKKIEANQERQEPMSQKKKIVVEEENDPTPDEKPSVLSESGTIDEEALQPSEAMEEIEERLAAVQAEADENRDRLLRMAADLDNYKKRAARELEDLKKYATENLIRQLLTVVDNLERAIASASTDNENGHSVIDGVALTLAEIMKILERHHVSPIQALGEPFDPAFHQAMSQEESRDQPPNTVVKEFQKGYMIHDRLLRPAMVVVSKAAGNGQPAEKTVDTNA